MSLAGRRFAWAAALGVGVLTGIVLLRKRRRRRAARQWTGWRRNGYSCLPHVSERSRQVAEAAKLRPTDVVVITFPKTGTTLLQQTCEQLRTGGDMSFSEITERQPWLDFAWDCGQDIDAAQVAHPRLFKSHQLFSAINRGAKCLSMVRDPKAVLLSWFAFQKLKGRPLFVSLADANEYARAGNFEGANIFGTNVWDFYVELWEVRHEPNVLALCYETLVKDARSQLPAIARFIGVPAGEDLLQRVEAMTSKAFMLEHQEQFDDHFIMEKGGEMGRAAKVLEAGSKVTPGHKDVLTAETLAWLDQNWKTKVTPRTGLATYEDLVKALVV
mmetsp:Transcript_9370/g.21311  ORF Transcript_9370/g.21311 Transcript_9370/m.21311 type:complete len:329 (+) Transcript_9370:75-1061(+)